jgi:hypothetical protein
MNKESISVKDLEFVSLADSTNLAGMRRFNTTLSNSVNDRSTNTTPWLRLAFSTSIEAGAGKKTL